METATSNAVPRSQGLAAAKRSRLSRPVLVAIWCAVLAIASEQAQGQNWLQRYMREHRPKAAGSQQQTDASVQKAEATPAPADPAAPATPTAQAAEPEVRRALPVEGAELVPFDSTVPAAAPAPIPTATPAPTPAAVPMDTPLPIRRAEPVTAEEAAALLRSSEPPQPAQPQPTAVSTPRVELQPSAEATPVRITTPRLTPASIKRARPERTPVPEPPVAAATPEPAPTPEADTPEKPVLKAQPVAAATPAATSSPEDQLDPTQNVIRLSPGAITPADVSQITAANDYYTRKEFDHASTEYERYLNLFPRGRDVASATYRLAECYRQLNNFNAARKSYESLIFSLSENEFVGPASFRLADLCFQDKNYSDALTFYRKASVRLKDPALMLLAKFNAARCLEYQKFSEDAIRAYEDILLTKENNPFREASMFAAARLTADTGRKSEAIQRLNALREQTTKPAVRAEAAVRAGLLMLDLGLNTKALSELKKALSLPELGEWREVAELGVLRILYNQGKYQAVLDTYRTAGKEFSAAVLPEVLLIVATSNRQLSKCSEARALYERAIHEFPGSVYAREAQYERIITLYSMDAPELIKEVDEYLASNPEAGNKRDQLTLVKAESLYKTKQFEAAAPIYAALENSTSLVPFLKAEALFKRGWCLVQIRSFEEAIKVFTAFLDRYPANRMAATALAQRALSHQRLNNFKVALADLGTLLSQYPTVKERELALQQKALILGQQEDNQGMVEAFAQLIREFPKSAAAGQANYWIGSVAMQAKKYRDAITPLENARKLDKDFSERATTLLLWARYSLEERDATASEVDHALANKAGRIKVPVEILRWLGMAYLTADDAKHADKYLTMLTGRSKEEEVLADDWLNLGRTRIKMEKWADAQAALKVYLQTVSDPVPQATGELAMGEAKLGSAHLDEAEESANHVLQLQPEGRLNSQGRMLLGDIAMVRRDYEKAAKLFESVSILGVEDAVITPKALEKAYLAYKKSGDDDHARKILNELQTRFPEHQLTGASTTARSSSRP